MKVTSEKLPKSLMTLEIELDRDQVEKGLDRAARRLAQKYTIPGFRKGKAPRFIIENYLGRAALVEEATEDLINKSFRAALEQEKIAPVGKAQLEAVNPGEPFTFRVTVPVPPTATVGDYRAITVPLEVQPITDEVLGRSMEALRDKHVVLQELEAPRPAQQGDQLTVKIESLVEGEPLEERAEGQELQESTLDLEPGRLVDELYEGLLGTNIGDKVEITATMPDDHANEEVRGKEVTFHVEVVDMKQRLLPEWDELPTLEEFEGSVDELREKTRKDLEQSAQDLAERQTVDSFIDQLVAQTDYDIPDVVVSDLADQMLQEQGRQYERYGITLDQMLQYRGKSRAEAAAELLPDAEQQTKITLALRELVRNERLSISNTEIDSEIGRILEDYSEDQRPSITQLLQTQLVGNIANMVLDRKLRDRMLAIATGHAPDLSAEADEVDEAAEPAMHAELATSQESDETQG